MHANHLAEKTIHCREGHFDNNRYLFTWDGEQAANQYLWSLVLILRNSAFLIAYDGSPVFSIIYRQHCLVRQNLECGGFCCYSPVELKRNRLGLAGRIEMFEVKCL